MAHAITGDRRAVTQPGPVGSMLKVGPPETEDECRPLDLDQVTAYDLVAIRAQVKEGSPNWNGIKRVQGFATLQDLARDPSRIRENRWIERCHGPSPISSK